MIAPDEPSGPTAQRPVIEVAGLRKHFRTRQGRVTAVDGLVPWRERRRLARRIGVVFGQRSQLSAIALLC